MQLACELAALGTQPALAWAAISQGIPELTDKRQESDAAKATTEGMDGRRVPHILACLAAAAEAAIGSSRAAGRPEETLGLAEAAVRAAERILWDAGLEDRSHDADAPIPGKGLPVSGAGGDEWFIDGRTLRQAVAVHAPRLIGAYVRACLLARRPRLAAASLLPALGTPSSATHLRSIASVVVIALAQAGDEEAAAQVLQAMAAAGGCGVPSELREQVQRTIDRSKAEDSQGRQ